MIEINNTKNRERDAYSFANINLLGKCNVGCFFCLGRDIEKELAGQDQRNLPFQEWRNFPRFLNECKEAGITKLYITGQNTDSLLYKHLTDLICFLQGQGFQVGLRTNGYLASDLMLGIMNQCDLSVGYSIHTLNPITNKMIMGRQDFPDWERIIPATKNPRVSIVLNRCNEYEFFDLLKWMARFKNVRYVQVRRVSTDTRLEFLAPDITAYERVYTQVKNIFGPATRRFVADAEEYSIYGMPVTFWRTVKTSVNSMNYFTDGTISPMYFVVEGYLKHRAQNQSDCMTVGDLPLDQCRHG